MTTVAWDGRSLAADSQITSEFKTTGHSKFFRFRDGSIGAFAGTWANVQAAQRFLDHQVDECPTTEWTAIVMRPGGRVDVLECDGSVLDITTIPYALGSGQAYALAAMACGKTAQEAVYVAASFDPYTGGPIEEHRLSDVAAVAPKRKTATRKS
jgi:hypothetical protein